MDRGVFINYRAEDSHSYGALLYNELTRQFGDDLVFLDCESIPAGADFPTELLDRVRSAGVLLVVIGPRWLTAVNDAGRRRIEDSADWIRRELAEAFTTGIRVIPILTDDAELPREADLPTELAALSRCQARQLRRREPTTDLARIVADLVNVNPNLADAARRHNPPATSPAGESDTAVNQLPTDTSDFVGRQSDLESLDLLLHDRAGKSNAVIITAVSGAPGIGKTALAVHWAHQVSEHFPDGQLYVNLRGYDPGAPMPPDLVLESFLKAFGVPGEKIPHDLEALSATYRSIVAHRRVLVVLDNARTTSQVLPLLPGSPSCTVVVTSRSRLSGLIARTDALRIDVDALPMSEAVTLLRRRIGQGAVSLGQRELERLAELCGCLPLALRIAAERIAEQPDVDARDLIDELTHEWERLDALAVEDDDLTTVRSVFSWSYRALDPESARCFRLLGLHPGPEFGVAAASTLMDRPVAEARRRLHVLAGLHLLGRAGRDRYQFHDLLRVYAAETAAADSTETDRRDAVRRVLSSYLRHAVAASRVVYPNRRSIEVDRPDPIQADPTFDDRAAALRWYEIEQHNLSGAMRLAATAGENDLAWKLPAVLTDLLWKQRWTDAMTILRGALDAATASGDHLGLLFVLLNFADLSLDLERYDEATGYFTQIRDLAVETSEDDFLGWALNGLGNAHVGREELDEAINCLRGALVVFQAIDYKGAEASVLDSLAIALLHKGQAGEALAHCERSLAIAEEFGDLWRLARAEQTMGLLHDALGRPDLAIGHLERALSMHREYDNRFAAARTLTDLGDILNNTGRVEDAVNAWHEALVILNDLGAPQAAALRIRLAGP